MLLSVFPIFAPLQPEKIIFAAVFFIRYVCEYLIYRKTPKSVLFAVCSRLLADNVCQYYLQLLIRLYPSFLFSFSLAFCFTKFVCEILCKFLNVYASLKCMFMQSIMINRKLCGNFRLFCHFAAHVLSFYFFVSSFSFCLNYSEENENRNEKAVFFADFAIKRPFLSQIKR